MFAHFWTRSAATGRPSRTSVSAGRGVLLAISCALFAVSCSSAPPPAPLAGPDPADPRARVPAAAYRSTVGPYARQRPVGPLPWREQNQRVAPPAKP